MTSPDETKPESNVPKVFISYSHDSIEHADRVLALSDRLREDGVNTILDQYEPWPSEGWPLWMERNIRDADLVLMICTETYCQRVTREEKPGKGLGVRWEGKLIYNHVYRAESENAKFIPVTFTENDVENIPTPVADVSFYVLDSEAGYEALYRHLTGQPSVQKPGLGAIKKLPPRERQWSVRPRAPLKKVVTDPFAQRLIAVIIVLMVIGGILCWKNKNDKAIILAAITAAEQFHENNEHEKALASCANLLEKVSQRQYPELFAKIKHLEGACHYSLALISDKESRLQNAIDAYNSSLKIWTIEKYPLDYAMTQNNLGIAYDNLSSVRDKESNLDQAIKAYEQALKIYTIEKYPLNYATTQYNLGIAYERLADIQDEKANLKNAVEAFTEAQKVYKDELPEEYEKVALQLQELNHILSSLPD